MCVRRLADDVARRARGRRHARSRCGTRLPPCRAAEAARAAPRPADAGGAPPADEVETVVAEMVAAEAEAPELAGAAAVLFASATSAAPVSAVQLAVPLGLSEPAVRAAALALLDGRARSVLLPREALDEMEASGLDARRLDGRRDAEMRAAARLRRRRRAERRGN
jgi:hypothetical protein